MCVVRCTYIYIDMYDMYVYLTCICMSIPDKQTNHKDIFMWAGFICSRSLLLAASGDPVPPGRSQGSGARAQRNLAGFRRIFFGSVAFGTYIYIHRDVYIHMHMYRDGYM